MPQPVPSRFLILEDEPYLARALERLVASFGEATVVNTAWQADAALAAQEPWDAFLFDIGLPDGSGLDVLERARHRYPGVPALVQTGRLEPDLVNRAFDLRAGMLMKPIVPARVEEFARAVVRAPGSSLRSRIEALVAVWVQLYGLSPAEADVLRRGALGESRETIATSRGSSPLTVKKQVTNLLALTKDPTFGAAIERLLRAVAEDPA